MKKYDYINIAATFSHWNIDAEFQETYNMIKNYSLVDIYRCYELWDLVWQSAKLEEGDIIEIGVWRGGTGALIAKQAKNHNIEKVYLCDTFTGVVKAGKEDSAYRGGEHSDASKDNVETLMKSLNLDNYEILEGIFPEQTGEKISDARFRFCHIDVDTYQSAKDSIDFLWDKIVSGGIIVYDDYGFVQCDGIKNHIDEMKYLKDRIVFYNLNGHAIVIKK